MKQTKIRKGDLLIIDWEDAKTIHEPTYLDELQKENLLPARTVGYLIDHNKERIILCSLLFLPDTPPEQRSYKTNHIIPLTQIKKITKAKQ